MPPSTRAKSDQVMIATESGAMELDGATVTFKRGITKVRASHPLVVANPQYFEPADRSVTYEDEVEQATAAPGEKRGAQARAGAAA